MTTFLLQTVKGKIVHDFAFEMERSIEYQIWRNNFDFKIEYCEIEDIKYKCDNIKNKIIPIGSIEFFHKFCEIYFNIKEVNKVIKPLNIPKDLFTFAGRRISNFKINENRVNSDFLEDIYELSNSIGQVFIKSNDIIKFEENGITSVNEIINNKYKYPDGGYQISEIIHIDSEYRCFIYNGELIGIQFYNGDFKLFPNVKVIQEITKQFKDYSAYTIDIGVNYEGDTFLIECHDFYSCGLYGFSDYNKLPYMFIRAFNKVTKNLNYDTSK